MTNDEEPWLPFDQGDSAWQHEVVEDEQPAIRTARPMRRRGMVVGFVIVGLAIALGGGAFGADAYATRSICAAVGATDTTTPPDGVSKGTDVALDRARQTLTGTATLLLFHPQLRDATRGLAADLGQLRVLRNADDGDAGAAASTASAQMLVVASSVDSYARQAQTACGLPADGILRSVNPAKTATVQPVVQPAPRANHLGRAD